MGIYDRDWYRGELNERQRRARRSRRWVLPRWLRTTVGALTILFVRPSPCWCGKLVRHTREIGHGYCQRHRCNPFLVKVRFTPEGSSLRGSRSQPRRSCRRKRITSTAASLMGDSCTIERTPSGKLRLLSGRRSC